MRMEIQTLSTNEKKWDFLIQHLNGNLLEFVKTIIPELPANLYKVEVSGFLCDGFDVKPYYLYPFNTWIAGKKPTKKEIETLSDNISNGIEFTTDKLSFEYSYYWSTDSKARTGISFKDFMDMKRPYFTDKALAEEYSNAVKEQNKKDKAFDELHKKDKNYDYRGNGYKDLGWQNGWKHVYFDEDGKQTTGDVSKGEKPKKTFGYTKEDYPEYGRCIEMKHRRIEVSHNNRGTQHDVSCPECKIVWHYDSSD